MGDNVTADAPSADPHSGLTKSGVISAARGGRYGPGVLDDSEDASDHPPAAGVAVPRSMYMRVHAGAVVPVKKCLAGSSASLLPAQLALQQTCLEAERLVDQQGVGSEKSAIVTTIVDYCKDAVVQFLSTIDLPDEGEALPPGVEEMLVQLIEGLSGSKGMILQHESLSFAPRPEEVLMAHMLSRAGSVAASRSAAGTSIPTAVTTHTGGSLPAKTILGPSAELPDGIVINSVVSATGLTQKFGFESAVGLGLLYLAIVNPPARESGKVLFSVPGKKPPKFRVLLAQAVDAVLALPQLQMQFATSPTSADELADNDHVWVRSDVEMFYLITHLIGKGVLFADAKWEVIPAHVWAVLFAPLCEPLGLSATTVFKQMELRLDAEQMGMLTLETLKKALMVLKAYPLSVQAGPGTSATGNLDSGTPKSRSTMPESTDYTLIPFRDVPSTPVSSLVKKYNQKIRSKSSRFTSNLLQKVVGHDNQPVSRGWLDKFRDVNSPADGRLLLITILKDKAQQMEAYRATDAKGMLKEMVFPHRKAVIAEGKSESHLIDAAIQHILVDGVYGRFTSPLVLYAVAWISNQTSKIDVVSHRHTEDASQSSITATIAASNAKPPWVPPLLTYAQFVWLLVQLIKLACGSPTFQHNEDDPLEDDIICWAYSELLQVGSLVSDFQAIRLREESDLCGGPRGGETAEKTALVYTDPEYSAADRLMHTLYTIGASEAGLLKVGLGVADFVVWSQDAVSVDTVQDPIAVGDLSHRLDACTTGDAADGMPCSPTSTTPVFRVSPPSAAMIESAAQASLKRISVDATQMGKVGDAPSQQKTLRALLCAAHGVSPRDNRVKNIEGHLKFVAEHAKKLKEVPERASDGVMLEQARVLVAKELKSVVPDPKDVELIDAMNALEARRS